MCQKGLFHARQRMDNNIRVICSTPLRSRRWSSRGDVPVHPCDDNSSLSATKNMIQVMQYYVIICCHLQLSLLLSTLIALKVAVIILLLPLLGCLLIVCVTNLTYAYVYCDPLKLLHHAGVSRCVMLSHARREGESVRGQEWLNPRAIKSSGSRCSRR